MVTVWQLRDVIWNFERVGASRKRPQRGLPSGVEPPVSPRYRHSKGTRPNLR